ncbi:MAG: putative saccharopine dehydrogenase/reductase [Pseudonocardiales bacterium]|nr:putative saccharopine dehydrogenase/reductase [Pseudonocardiales bacterium]
MPGRRYDIVLFGATGFVGQLIAADLADSAPCDVRIALAGRSLDKLTALQARLGLRATDWALVVADVGDEAALTTLAESTRVLATTVGPYLRYGLPVVKACARAGTDYLDLSGEALFVRHCIDQFDETARASGARIVNSCGFDSVPSDLGVLLLAEKAQADGAGGLTDTTMVVRSLRGGVSGGTIDSLRAQTEAMNADRDTRRMVTDPYALSPRREDDPAPRYERDDYRVRNDPELGWTGPFVMASYNTRIVRRSNALMGYAYGRSFRYREVMGFGRGRRAPVLATLMTAGLGLFAAGMSRKLSRRVLDRLLPAPGSGPSEKTQRSGRFRIEVRTTTTTGARYSSTVAAKGDPGYAATAVMFAQCALTLALDRSRLPGADGVTTPAAGLGRPLIERLRAAGLTLTVTALD